MANREKNGVPAVCCTDPVKDKLRPIYPLDLSKCRTIDDLVRAMGGYRLYGARRWVTLRMCSSHGAR
jgi:hypothetical protein